MERERLPFFPYLSVSFGEYSRGSQAIYWVLENGAASVCCKIKHNKNASNPFSAIVDPPGFTVSYPFPFHSVNIREQK